jgi:hypothetical protein
MVQSQPRQIVCETLSWKKPISKKGWWSGSRCRPWVQAPATHTQKVFAVVLPCGGWIAGLLQARHVPHHSVTPPVKTYFLITTQLKTPATLLIGKNWRSLCYQSLGPFKPGGGKHAPKILATWEAEAGGWVQELEARLDNKMRPYLWQ